VDTVVVRDAISPTISFSTSNACISNENSFSATSSDDTSITTWNWDFGDGTGTASGQSVEYQYANTGTFDVGLAIDAENGCSNSASKKIHIYNPPNPSFSYTSGVTCSNSPLDFVNSTAFSGPDSLLSFQWNMNDEMLLDDSAPSYIFKTGGEKYVTLTAYIPGCDNVASELIDITPGPETAFTFSGQLRAGVLHLLQCYHGKRHHWVPMGFWGWLYFHCSFADSPFRISWQLSG
jgi:PKD repeat protein